MAHRFLLGPLAAVALSTAIRGMAAPPKGATSTPPASVTMPAKLLVYDGQLAGSAGIRLGPWGSGVAEDVSSPFIGTGGHSIAVTAQGLYAGGRLDFTNPLPIKSDD